MLPQTGETMTDKLFSFTDSIYWKMRFAWAAALDYIETRWRR
jgi:hypothetical protein